MKPMLITQIRIFSHESVEQIVPFRRLFWSSPLHYSWRNCWLTQTLLVFLKSFLAFWIKRQWRTSSPLPSCCDFQSYCFEEHKHQIVQILIVMNLFIIFHSVAETCEEME
jgi:hypothetical protein